MQLRRLGYVGFQMPGDEWGRGEAKATKIIIKIWQLKNGPSFLSDPSTIQASLAEILV